MKKQVTNIETYAVEYETRSTGLSDLSRVEAQKEENRFLATSYIETQIDIL